MSVDWDYYDKFEELNGKYLPERGEGCTKATQIITALNKLVYKWYNDGDVFDNTKYLEGWANDLSSYANWLYHHTTEEVQTILNKVYECINDDDYEELLKELSDLLFNEKYLEEQNKLEKEFSIYDYDGKFKFVEFPEHDDYDDYDDWEEEEEDY